MATRIGIISDTHIPGSRPELWDEVRVAFKGVDLIFHAGDLEMLRVLDWLEEIAPVVCAEGNHDVGLPPDSRVKPRQFLDIEGFSIAMAHQVAGWSFGIDVVLRHYLGLRERPDIVVCGDTHFEEIRYEDGLLIVNPGSATYPHNLSTRLGHLAFLELEQGKPPQAKILDLATLANR